jgi:hypothetical protein
MVQQPIFGHHSDCDSNHLPMSYLRPFVSRNGNDSKRAPAKTTSHWQIWAPAFAACSKGLNLRRDSICGGAVIFLSIAQNKFTNCLRWSEAEWNFRATERRYDDK